MKIKIKVTKKAVKRVAWNFGVFVFAYIGCGTVFMFIMYTLLGDPMNKYTFAKALGGGLGLGVARIIILGVHWVTRFVKAYYNRTIVKKNSTEPYRVEELCLTEGSSPHDRLV